MTAKKDETQVNQTPPEATEAKTPDEKLEEEVSELAEQSRDKWPLLAVQFEEHPKQTELPTDPSELLKPGTKLVIVGIGEKANVESFWDGTPDLKKSISEAAFPEPVFRVKIAPKATQARVTMKPVVSFD